MTWEAAFAAETDALARNGGARPPATLSEVWDAEWSATGLSTSFGVTRPTADAADELEQGIERAAGRPVAELAPGRAGATLRTGSPRERAGVLAGIAAELPPEQQEQLKPLLDVDGAARRKAQDIEARSAEVAGRTYGLKATALSYATGIARQAVDPINLVATGVTAPFGGAGGMGLATFLGREFAANAAAQAAQEPFIQPARAQLGLEAGFTEAAKDVVGAGIGGAAIGGFVIRPLGKLWSRWREGRVAPLNPGDTAGPQPRVPGVPEPAIAERSAAQGETAAPAGELPPARLPDLPRDVGPEDLDAVAHLVERDTALDLAAHDPTPEGRLASAEATDATARALEAAEPLPRGPADDVAPPRQMEASAGDEPPPKLVKARRVNRGDERTLSITDYIARNGGLPLEAEWTGMDLHRTPRGGGGMLARSRGRSVDGYWRERLIEAGYLPPDPEGGVAREITDELREAIRRDLSGDRVYTEAGAARRAERDLAAEEKAVATLAGHIREQLGDLYPDEIPPNVLHGAAERLHAGEARSALEALDAAFVAHERGLAPDQDLAKPLATRHDVPLDDIPFDAPETGRGQGEVVSGLRRDAGPEGTGGAGPGPSDRPGGPRGGSPDAGGPAREPAGGAAAVGAAASERTPAGEQSLLPGVAPVSDRARLEAGAAKPLRGGDRAPPEGGLFDATARAQTDLVEQAAAARRADVERALEAAGGNMTIKLEDGSEVSARELLRKTEAGSQAASELQDCILRGAL